MNLNKIQIEISSLVRERQNLKKQLFYIYVITILILGSMAPTVAFGIMFAHKLAYAGISLIAIDLSILGLQKLDIRDCNKVLSNLLEEKNGIINKKQDTCKMPKLKQNKIYEPKKKIEYKEKIQPKKENREEIPLTENIIETTLNNEGIIYTKEQAIKELEKIKLEFLNEIEQELGFSKVLK